MTDDTQPEAMDLADWLEAVGGGPSAKRCAALLRRQHARIAELEAQIEALSGVQALSAAPEAIAKLRHLYQNMVNGAVRDTASAKRIAEGLLAPAIEALERATPPAEQQAQPGAVYAELHEPDATTVGLGAVWNRHSMRGFADRTHALRMEQAAPKAAQGVGNSGFDHKTAADLLNNKTVSDEAVRKFVATSRWAHDEKAALSAMLLSVRGVLASREAEIALLKKALMEAEAAPQQEAQEPAPSAAVFGLRLVPVEPTDQMVQAAHHIDLSYMPGQEGADRAAIYRAMIAAAPQPAVQQWNDLIGKETHADADGLLELVAAPQQEAQPNYVVSLVVVKEIPTGVNTRNKLYTVNAASADEAVGKAVLQMPSDFPEHRLHTACFVAAPAQPAPAPLSERDAFERDWEKRHAPVPINGRTHDDGRYGDSSIQDAWESWQARAALAAQGGKDA